MLIKVEKTNTFLCFSLRPRQNGWHFPGDIFKCILFNENVWVLNKISLKFANKGLLDNNTALVQIMAWHRTGNKPLSEPMMASFDDAYMHHLASMSWINSAQQKFILVVWGNIKFQRCNRICVRSSPCCCCTSCHSGCTWRPAEGYSLSWQWRQRWQRISLREAGLGLKNEK